MDLYDLTACEILKLFKEEECSVHDYSVEINNRIISVDQIVCAWEYYNSEQFLEHALDLSKKISRKELLSNKIPGLPIGVKDIFNTKNMPTSMGSKIWKGFTPGNNARVVDSIIENKGLITGKTVTAEFAVHEPGKTKNPYSSSRLPGTSSSGSAVAVATGMVPIALGTQTAGSTTRPASYCGVYGFKPSFGIIPRTGVLKTLDTLDHVTILARSVNDCRLLTDTLRVSGRNHPFVHQLVDKSKNLNLFKPIKVAFVKTVSWKNLEKYSEIMLTRLAKQIQSLDGVEVHEVELPDNLNDIHEKHDIVYNKALSYYFKEEYLNHYAELSDSFKSLYEKGVEIDLQTYNKALKHQVNSQDSIDNFFDNFDIVLSMSTTGEAPNIGDKELPDAALIWTYLHVPSICVPISLGPNKLPVSAQFASKKYNDYILLDFIEMLKTKDIINDTKVINPKK